MLRYLGLLLEAGVGVVTLGMILVALGVLKGPFFLPGVYLVLLGSILCAAAGLNGVRSASHGS